ncbi:MAG: hypothetical protein U5K31_12460 [Balneolaceae bacterium]|nr:hypothetical protein [Balneolaceae bacterium]
MTSIRRPLSALAGSLALALLLLLSSALPVQAQYFSFGKNRVQYTDFDWRYIQSEHFDVFYYDSENYDLANFTARVMESSLRQIHEDFDHQIIDRIKVVVYDSHNDFSQTNVAALPVNAEGIGGATEPFKNRIIMPFSGNYDEFRSTLQHELVHAVVNDMFYGGNVQSLVSGRAQLQIPNWFDEGLAEYISVAWDTNTDMFMRDGLLNDYMPAINQLSGYLAYRGGQSIWNFIVEEYGRQKIGEILHGARATRTINGAFQRALGMNIEQLSEAWHDYYRKIYFPEVAQREDLDNFAEHITERGKLGTYNTSPALSPQGDKIAMITNHRGYFDVVVVSAVTGEVLKTLISGQDNVEFEELNILNPNLTWSPDGSQIALSAKSQGKDHLAIVDYQTGNKQFVEFPELSAIGSVSWSPDGSKIAFDGNIGPLQDIFVYNVEERNFINVTNDAITDVQPAWGADSQTIYFTSARGDNLQLGTFLNNADLLRSDFMYTTDIYSVRVGEERVTRLTNTPGWNEDEPVTTRDGRLIYISDENGIRNVFEMNLDDRISTPLTNLLTGVQQISVSSDGTRLAVASINEGYTDIFLVRQPLTRARGQELQPNRWAQRRATESYGERVPAIRYVKQMFGSSGELITGSGDAVETDPRTGEAMADAGRQADDTTTTDTTGRDARGNIDFRNYVFESSVSQDTAFTAQYLDDSTFAPINSQTEDGRFQPKDYRLRFTTDLVYSGGGFSTYYGGYGMTQIVLSDLLGDHQIVFGSNLVLDLRNSNYYLQYGNFKDRWNWQYTFFHNASSYQGFSGQVYRFRNYGLGVSAQYPIDQFRRLDFSLSGIGLAQDFSVVGQDATTNNSSEFLYPQIIFTSDRTLAGYTHPIGGSRYSLSLTGSPPITGNTLHFASLLGDFRKYFNLGAGYSVALRGAGAVSLGRDSQTFFMGGMQGWINRRFNSETPLPLDKLGDTFITLPALPLRGHAYNAIYGDKFTMTNLEFRFPLFAAILPGPIPFLPLYNMQGVAFFDAGMAWGKDIEFSVPLSNGMQLPYFTNDGDFDFHVQERGTKYYDNATGNVVDNLPDEPEDERYSPLPFRDGDVLIGAGFGLRTIVFGLPLRYDVGWPYYSDGFAGKPVHYISLGLDF